MRRHCSVLLTTLLSTVCLSTASVTTADDGVAYFETHIRPVLIEHCLECHSSDSDELGGNLGLDSATAWQTGGDSGPAIVPGDPDASPLIEALRYDGLEMPPSSKLPDEVVRHFEIWVKQGAADPRMASSTPARRPSGIDLDEGRKFWAFQPVDDPAVPATSIDQPIDHFITAKQHEASLPASTLADPATRARRLAYDLTGLPPNPADVKDFLNNPTDANWVALVDRLLAKQDFGEHWARMWLDIARYADSNGSDFNATYHDAWRYRDYVIDSFNEDRPFRRFVMEQIAGDLLPYETPEQQTRQIVATGFLALGAKMLSERDKDKLQLDIVDEQIDTVGKAFMGMTLGCARCHDHKFDPIPTADYYALAGIFQSTETVQGEIQRYVSDLVRTPLPVSPELAAEVAAYKVRKKQLEDQLAAVKKKIDKKRASASLDAWLALGVVLDTDKAELVGNWKESTYSKNRLGPNYVHNDRQSALMTATFRTDLPASGEYEVRLAFSGTTGREKRVPLSIDTADGPVEVFVDQSKRPKYADTWQPIGRFGFAEIASLTISTKGTKDYVIVDAVQFVPVADADEPPVTAADDTQLVEKRDALSKQLDELKKNSPPDLPTALAVRDVEKPADCAVRIRGEPHRMGDEVPRGFLQVAMTTEPPAMPEEESGRVELARWLASPDNPLTARVYVNRVWAQLFGHGLVRSPHNFGDLGQRPTHPELLDWLATRFMENKWSTKSLVKMIVCSDAYSATSLVGEAVAEADPENHLLTRANRRPLTVEQLRDSLLLLGGQLDRSRTVAPMKGIGKLVSNNSAMPKSAKSAASTTVRTVYLPIIRNELQDMLAVFDFADPEMSVGRRARTNVPSQALFLMNSKLVRQTADAIATSIADDPAPVTRLYTTVLGRQPSVDLQQRLEAFVASYDDPQSGLAAAAHALLASTEFRVLE